MNNSTRVIIRGKALPGTQPQKNIIKIFATLFLFVFMGHYIARAQATNPACNIAGPLTACSVANPADTTHDFVIYITVAKSTANSMISYSFASNSAGAFIRKDLHGTILHYQGTATGVTNARAAGVYNAGTNTTYDTLVVFPGTSGFDFNLQVNDTTKSATNNTCECSKSVSIADISASLSYPAIQCYGGNTTLTVNGFGASVDYFDTLYAAGINFPNGTTGNPNPTDFDATFTGIVAGTYKLAVYSQVDGCGFDTSFTISQPPISNPIVLKCPANDTVASCQTQSQINTEFAAWLASASFTGGNNASLSNNYNSDNGTPSNCGGSMSVTFTVTGTCQSAQSCTSTFTVPAAPPVVLQAPANDTVAACQTQAAVNAEFAAWLASASASGGCGTVVTNNYNTDNGAPAACGGSRTITFTANSNCQSPVSSTATFTVPVAAALVLQAPANDTVAACQTQAAVNAEFTAWLATAGASGCNSGISNNNTGAPLACGGSTTVTFTATSTCQQSSQTANATFVVKAAPPLVLNAPANDTVASCQTQAAVNAEFTAWLASASTSGGCGTSLSNNNTGAPSSCGGSTTVTFTANSNCQSAQTANATFVVKAAPPVVLNAPANDTVASCQTQAQVNAEFTAWLASASASGGCGTSLSNNNTGAPSSCGGSATVTFTASSNCQSAQTANATFVVKAAPPVVLNAPANDTVASCQTQAAVNAEFTAWLASASANGGCGTSLSNNNTGAPSSCGGSATVTFTASSNCQSAQTANATFVVKAAPPVVLNAPANDTVASCQTQAQVNAEFTSWLNSATAGGGCGSTLSNNYNTDNGAPAACGGSVSVTYTANSNCQASVSSTATFAVRTGKNCAACGFVCTPVQVPVCTCNLSYPDSSNLPKSGVVFNESEVLEASDPGPTTCGSTGSVIKLWYNDEHALTLGVRSVVVKHHNGTTTTTNYPITATPASATCQSYPVVGDTISSGVQSGNDVAAGGGRPLWPALFVTDLTVNGATSRKGDWQQGGKGTPPSGVCGTWKGAVKTVDSTTAQPTITITPDADPAAKDNWSLGSGADVPPGGFSSLANQGYGAECRWNVSDLGLIAGHTYRLQFMVHDGDQNKSGGDCGENCTTIAIPDSTQATCIQTVHLTKTASVCEINQGTPTAVTYTYVVTNTGQISASGTIKDDKGNPSNPAVTVCSWGPLAPGDSATCTFVDTISNTTTNIATAYATFAGSNAVDTATATATVTALGCSCALSYPDNSNLPRSNVAFNESSVLEASDPGPNACGGASSVIKLWYNDEHAMTLGVRSVVVKHHNGTTTTTNYPITATPASATCQSYPLVGDTISSGVQSGNDVAAGGGRPLWPALFVTDLTVNGATSRKGDWQQGGKGTPPSGVCGTWKGAVKTVDSTTAQPTITITPDADPAAKDNWSLGSGADVPPGGFSSLANQGYGAECRWNVSDLGLIAGHTYRLQFMVHDGDQNQAGGDCGENCTTLNLGTGSPCGPGQNKMDMIDNSTNQENTVAAGAGDFIITVYPNPSANNFHLGLSTSSNDNINIEIYDMLGRVVENLRGINYDNNITFGNSLNSGMYLVQVSQGSKIQALRIIKAQ